MCRVNVAIDKNQHMEDIYDSIESMGLSNKLRTDVAHLAFELATNAYMYAKATTFEVTRHGNSIIFEHDGTAGIDPFDASNITERGAGLKAVEGFKEIYSSSITHHYIPFNADDNQRDRVSISFNEDIEKENVGERCKAIIKRSMILGSRVATHITNELVIPEGCETVTFYLDRGAVPVSSIKSFVEEIVRKTSANCPNLVFKIDSDDLMVKRTLLDVKSRIEEEYPGRSVLVN
jgi:hypothetical protein